MTLKDELEQHALFYEATLQYIRDCAKNGTSPEMIMETFKEMINIVIKEGS